MKTKSDDDLDRVADTLAGKVIKAGVLLAKFLARGLTALVVLIWIRNVDYYPVYAKIELGMTRSQASELLQGIEVTRSLDATGIETWYFQEPDGYPSYFFYVRFEGGSVVSKEHDI